MSQEKIKNIIEAALMVSVKPLNVAKILSLFETDQTLELERDDILTAVKSLQEDYEERGIELSEVASGYRFQARDEYAEWVNHLFDERPPRYSRALLETLAIIAYRQPITRGEIEEIRGVSVSSTIVKTLQEREWVKVVGHRDVPGKPSLLATTKMFLDYFNLKKLSDLPALEDIKDFDSINPDLFEELEGEAKAAETEDKNAETDSDENPNVVDGNIEAVDEVENAEASTIEEQDDANSSDEDSVDGDSEEGIDEELAAVAIESEEGESEEIKSEEIESEEEADDEVSNVVPISN
ncbi:MAG TPA: SMC-Scp complex subunit ScpB [Thiotrichaceae bacterium]|jgi:segregation and condensation protein B|nr:SMC-Scp complex subunit ScpB [Thiotrichaceae bacterium]HIM07806.1 SMC-Scp complex subunit ScpB [Gammaproteobacteria bacterium]